MVYYEVCVIEWPEMSHMCIQCVLLPPYCNTIPGSNNHRFLAISGTFIAYRAVITAWYIIYFGFSENQPCPVCLERSGSALKALSCFLPGSGDHPDTRSVESLLLCTVTQSAVSLLWISVESRWGRKAIGETDNSGLFTKTAETSLSLAIGTWR